MAQTFSTRRAKIFQPLSTWKTDKAPGVLLTLLLICLAAVALYRLGPPKALAADAPPEEFSAARALKKLEGLSQAPHPMGTLEHARVRERLSQELAALGLTPEVQTATGVNSKRSNFPRAGTVSNIVARLKGTGGGNAVLLVAHYDTMPNSPGASDDGSAFVTLLESLRALKAGPALKNDVIFLFTDGEEPGLLGAEAFSDEHPYARDVGVVLNFETRGSSGPAIMFETSRENDWLLDQFAGAAPYPRANSLSYEIYRLLPNDTDLSVFKDAGLQGLNFAFIDGFMRYHSRADNLENIDERSLQHQGSYALALTRRFGNLQLPGEKRGGAVYFDVLGAAVLKYSAEWVLPLTIFTIGLFVALTGYGLRKGRLTVRGIALGVAAFILGFVLTVGVTAIGWLLIATVQRSFRRSLLDDLYQGKLYLAAFSAIGFALMTVVYGWFGRRANAEGLLTGTQLCWVFLLLLVSVLLPGGSYMLLWPLLSSFVAAALFLMISRGRTQSFVGFAALALCSSPAVILLVPMIYQLYVGVGLTFIGLVAVPIAILLGLLTAHFGLLGGTGSRLVPVVAAVTGIVLLVLAAFTFNFDKRHPRYDNVFYALNADTGKAVWASSDTVPDNWSAQFFGVKAERGSVAEFSPIHPGNYLKASAPALSLGTPQARLLDGGDSQGVRTLHLNLAPSYAGAQLTAFLDAKTEVLSAVVNGKKIGGHDPRAKNQAGQPWVLQYWATPAEGFDLTLEVRTTEPVKLALVERSEGLPETPGQSVRPRPDDLIPSPGQTSDATFVSKSYSF